VSRGSSSTEVTVGIDIGTTAVKAVAADEHGRVVARARIPHEVRVPEADRLEHDADDAWRTGPRLAMRQLARPDALAAAVSAMVPSLTAVDSEGRPITPGLLYGDARGRGNTGRSPASLAPEPGAFLTGEMAEFLQWTATQAPEAAGYWPAPAVANYALAGEAAIDLATAGTAYPLFDGSGWSVSACEDLGVSADRLPRVETMGAAIGRVFGTDTVLAAGAIDALCEQLVAGADGDGDVLVVCGTTLIVWATSSQANEVPGLWTVPRLLPGLSQIGGASNAGGLFLNWVDRLVGQGNTAAADPRRVPVWSPYVRGERNPLHDPDRRAVLDGLDLTHDATSLRRAAFEASAFVVRHLIDLSGVPVSRVVATGGGTRVEPWMQAISDATGVPVEVSGVAEGAALGAAFMARMAVGLESSMTDAARWASTQHIVEPDPAWTSATQDRYARFLELSGWPV
jgi:xylulokinase